MQTSWQIKLNCDKIVTNVSSVTFMGHQISADGMRPDPAKVSVINEMKAPANENLDDFLE